MCVGMLGYMPKYMGRTSDDDNIKMLINNSLWYFAIRVIYTRLR